MTEIQIFDGLGQQIQLNKNQLILENNSSKIMKHLPNLISGNYQTIDENQMFIANMPNPPKTLKISI